MKRFLPILLVGVCGAAAGIYFGSRWQPGTGEEQASASGAGRTSERPESENVRVTGRNRLELSPAAAKSLGVRLETASAAPSSGSLTLTGSLFIDSNRLVYVHSRFSGEVTEVGRVPAEPGDPEADPGTSTRPLRVGDSVKEGQLLAVVWSKEIGEKKSDLVEALSRVHASKARLDRLDGLSKGTVAAQVIFDARLQYESDLIDVERAERTLRSWKETEEEIAEVSLEAERIEQGKPRPTDGRLERTWANVEIRAPFSGTVLEKNVTVGEIADTTDTLFKIADLGRMGVLANVYEEDLPRLLALPADHRGWTVRLKSEPDALPIDGKFEVVGNIIDPGQHTAAVIGWIENPDRKLRVGQFITATVELPLHEDVVAVPNSAVIDVGTAAYVFVADGPDARHITMRQVEVVRRGRELALIRRAPHARAAGATEPVSSREPGSVSEGELVITSGNLELFGVLQNTTVADDDQNEKAGNAAGGRDEGAPTNDGSTTADTGRPARDARAGGLALVRGRSPTRR